MSIGERLHGRRGGDIVTSRSGACNVRNPTQVCSWMTCAHAHHSRRPGAGVALAIPAAAADLGRSAMQRHHLQVEQQQDVLNLDLGAVDRPPAGSGTGGCAPLDQLQLQPARPAPIPRPAAGAAASARYPGARNDGAPSSQMRDQRAEPVRRDAFAAERDFRCRQFELQQRRLTDSRPAPRHPAASRAVRSSTCLGRLPRSCIASQRPATDRDQQMSPATRT